ncbi:hypothetical protein MGG_17422 [Pyricularia oryzae 70-15]|uniref:Uncharacterized protein n=3 Tax=Pyricularia oryzae TaxID=318829 RepID=G4NBB4_PYRO7|nr:uncharacterized protein MGG_17422 [Pyricularia oryzae 70-15]EHA48876.1 hypothetical protein MGG_17422 [Pyricularia oryzae 70-15]ELQ38777.1 hypothetical protein OOU_Y34scaffold00528g69 [Pyricularia oryzae Y34]KAI7915106.1 hypothetical protein M0657_009198 [Pyricularia oryzae]KAI7917775.1 hypothetical protein M9X92_007245 [Pyricularia oryzae]
MLWVEVYDCSSEARKPRQLQREKEKPFCPLSDLNGADSIIRVGSNGNVSTVWSGVLNAYSAALAVLCKVWYRQSDDKRARVIDSFRDY